MWFPRGTLVSWKQKQYSWSASIFSLSNSGKVLYSWVENWRLDIKIFFLPAIATPSYFWWVKLANSTLKHKLEISVGLSLPTQAVYWAIPKSVILNSPASMAPVRRVGASLLFYCAAGGRDILATWAWMLCSERSPPCLGRGVGWRWDLSPFKAGAAVVEVARYRPGDPAADGWLETSGWCGRSNHTASPLISSSTLRELEFYMPVMWPKLHSEVGLRFWVSWY